MTCLPRAAVAVTGAAGTWRKAPAAWPVNNMVGPAVNANASFLFALPQVLRGILESEGLVQAQPPLPLPPSTPAAEPSAASASVGGPPAPSPTSPAAALSSLLSSTAPPPAEGASSAIGSQPAAASSLGTGREQDGGEADSGVSEEEAPLTFSLLKMEDKRLAETSPTFLVVALQVGA